MVQVLDQNLDDHLTSCKIRNKGKILRYGIYVGDGIIGRRVGPSNHIEAMVFSGKTNGKPSLGANLSNPKFLKKNIEPKASY